MAYDYTYELFMKTVFDGTVQARSQVNLLVNKLLYCQGTVYTCGNGGSSSTASHFTQDLVKICGIKSVCLTDNVPFLLATANDDDFRNVFKNYTEQFAKEEDIVLMISGSGNSENLVRLAKAMDERCTTFGLLGFDGGRLYKLCHYYIHVPVKDMLVVESAHSAILHYVIYRLAKHEPV